jgi:hypothetical protein
MRSAPGHYADTYSLLRQGETCWRTAAATRATLLVDSEQYFGALRRSLLQAQKQILIAGWDFDSRILLPPGPDDPPDDAPLQLGRVCKSTWLAGTTTGSIARTARRTRASSSKVAECASTSTAITRSRRASITRLS